MQLTSGQIHNLYNFVESRQVEFYDVQTELVDHLANDIEELWKEEPDLSYIQARGKSFKKFGIFGFSKIVEKKQRQLTKQYWKHAWEVFKAYFRLPKIMLIFFLIAVFYLILDVVSNKNLFLTSYLIVYTIIPFIVVGKRVLHLKKRKKTTGKKWLFDSINSTLGGYFHITHVFVQIILIEKSFEFTTTVQLMIATTLVLLSVLLYILIKVVPSKLEEIYTKQYPEFKLLEKA